MGRGETIKNICAFRKKSFWFYACAQALSLEILLYIILGSHFIFTYIIFEIPEK